jgi:hypothetical protein
MATASLPAHVHLHGHLPTCPPHLPAVEASIRWIGPLELDQL